MTIYPATITDKTGRVWNWSNAWGGYRSEGMMTHGYDTIARQWGLDSLEEIEREHDLIDPEDSVDPEPWVDQDGWRWSTAKKEGYLSRGPSTFTWAFEPRASKG